eukprot:GHRR01000538.1.p1 GENE.GHRR01000538.1~~GHRR01000538.1.p1  ORF type:complete len:590 (+),score=-84.07 GHRR01000538.1:330-2099(+)
MNKNIQDFFLSCKECILENPRNFYGCFSLGPFKNNQSLTVANALRRTLLSEIHGIAVTHLEINGVAHEYSTLVGVRESVLDILLNFKQIVLKNTSPLKKPMYGYLNIRGPGIVRASDLKLPLIIQCVDPDQYIATLNENGKLVLKFIISDFQNAQKTTNFCENFLSVQHDIQKLSNVDTLLKKPQFSMFTIFSNQRSKKGLNLFFGRKGFANQTTFKRLLTFNDRLPKKQQLFKEKRSTGIVIPKIFAKSAEAGSNLLNPLKPGNSANGSLDFAQNKASSISKPISEATQQRPIAESRYISKGQQLSTQFPLAHADGTNDLVGRKQAVSLWDQQENKKGNSFFSPPQSSRSEFIGLSGLRSPNLLWVDPLFHPVLKVNYTIETIEPIQTKIPNQIVMIELWTNGSIHPRKALYEALFYLKNMFEKLDSMKFLSYQFNKVARSNKKELVSSNSESVRVGTIFEAQETNSKFFRSFEYDFNFYHFLEHNKTPISLNQNIFVPQEIQQIEKQYFNELINQFKENWTDIPIEQLNLPSRVLNSLNKNNFLMIGDLLKFTPKQLKNFPGIGNFCIFTIQKHLKKIGLKLKTEKK